MNHTARGVERKNRSGSVGACACACEEGASVCACVLSCVRAQKEDMISIKGEVHQK